MKPLLKQAEGLYILLKQYDQTETGLPSLISAILFPNKNDNQNSNFDTTSTIPSNNNEQIVPSKIPIQYLRESHSINGKNSPVVSHTETV